jgi:acyl-CoA thioesterase
VTTVAQSASVVFVAAGREGDRLIAQAQEESQTGRSGVYAVKVRNQNGEIVAIFQGLSRSIGGSILPEN